MPMTPPDTRGVSSRNKAALILPLESVRSGCAAIGGSWIVGRRGTRRVIRTSREYLGISVLLLIGFKTVLTVVGRGKGLGWNSLWGCFKKKIYLCFELGALTRAVWDVDCLARWNLDYRFGGP